MPDQLPPQQPQGFRELTQEALDKKFSYSFTRAELLAIRAPILKYWNQFGLGDVKVFIDILDKIAPGLTLTNEDYVKDETPVTPEQGKVVVN